MQGARVNFLKTKPHGLAYNSNNSFRRLIYNQALVRTALVQIRNETKMSYWDKASWFRS